MRSTCAAALCAAVLVACGEQATAPPVMRGGTSANATAADVVSAHGSLAGRFVNPLWTADVRMTIAASGTNGQWEGAQGTVTWSSSPAAPGFGFDRVVADVKCVTGLWTLRPGEEFRRFVVKALPRTKLPAPYSHLYVVMEVWERDGVMEFSVPPQFEDSPDCSHGGGLSLGNVTPEHGRLQMTVPPSPAWVSPFSGPVGSTVTLHDAGGRFAASDIAYFVPPGGPLAAGVAALDVSVSPDGRQLLGRVPTLSSGGYQIIVAAAVGDPPRVPVYSFLIGSASFIVTP